MLARQPRFAPLLPRGAAEASERLMKQVGLLKPWMLQILGAPWYGRLIIAIEGHTLPGMSLEIGLRKRFMDDETRAALAAGTRQVLVVGAGLDTLCWRLAPEFPEVTFVEVDHPASQAMKREALGGLGPLPSNLHLAEADLARVPLDEALSHVPVWRKEAPSVVIIEAVLMYLDTASVSALLKAVHRSTGPGSQLLFTCVRNDEHGRLQAGPATRWVTEVGLRLAGEPLLWDIRAGELASFMERHGFRLDESPERVDLHRRYLVPAGMPEQPVGGVEFPAAAEKR
ncbi:SAM-dependent methyltransferase [Archangium violaceum]|uniref:class I SAM-dependent methyltransferase n=1 Tax=Archangium violaceum TaxID=83451 RepID=UPI00194E9715|nr:SAM-dependent methyltransferase [Archangium violaceum]QRN95203.1 SAM-dependent methyltransferase [Archangium violaceum]